MAALEMCPKNTHFELTDRAWVFTMVPMNPYFKGIHSRAALCRMNDAAIGGHATSTPVRACSVVWE